MNPPEYIVGFPAAGEAFAGKPGARFGSPEEVFAAVSQGTAVGGGKGNHRFAFKAVMFRKGIHNGRRFAPPDGVAQVYHLVIVPVLHVSRICRTDGAVFMFFGYPARTVIVVQIRFRIGHLRCNGVNITARLFGNGFSRPLRIAGGGIVHHNGLSSRHCFC